MHRVLLTRRWPAEVEKYLGGLYRLEVNESDRPLGVLDLQAAMRSFDAVCPTVTDRIDAEVLSAEPKRVKILANFGAGVSHIDLATCRRFGIAVTNTPDVLSETTAELALTLMLMVARRTAEGERSIRAGGWKGWSPTHLLGTGLTGRTLGLVGFGRIAQATARKAYHGFGMQVLYYSRRRAAPEVESQCHAVHCSSLDELLSKADFVSLHCPGGVETRHLIDARRLSQMKRSAFLINTARGEIVDERQLADALRGRVIAGAGLDVYEHEPQVTESLLELENVVLLPHLGSATADTRVAMGRRAAENLHRHFSGQPLRDLVIRIEQESPQ